MPFALTRGRHENSVPIESYRYIPLTRDDESIRVHLAPGLADLASELALTLKSSNLSSHCEALGHRTLSFLRKAECLSCKYSVAAYPKQRSRVCLADIIRMGAGPTRPNLSHSLVGELRTSFSQPRGLANREAIVRIVSAVKDRPQKSAPSRPMSGKSLAVFGSFFGAGSGRAAAVSTGAGGAVGRTATRIGTSAFGTGGGGGIFPVAFTSCETKVSGTSVTFVA